VVGGAEDPEVLTRERSVTRSAHGTGARHVAVVSSLSSLSSQRRFNTPASTITNQRLPSCRSGVRMNVSTSTPSRSHRPSPQCGHVKLRAEQSSH